MIADDEIDELLEKCSLEYRGRLTKIDNENILLVEGRDDKSLFEELTKKLDLDIQIISYSTVGLKKMLGLVKVLPGKKIRSLGITADANGDPNAKFQSIGDILRNENLPVPKSVLEVSGNGNIKVIVMILPGNGKGMLEDLLLKSVENDLAMPCVEEYIECLKKNNILPKKTSKVKVQTFLASREKPGTNIGIAAKAGYWPFDSIVFEDTKTFLKKIVSKE